MSCPKIDNNLSCHICQKVIVNIYNLRRHIEIHSVCIGRSFVFTVENCVESFKEKEYFWKHIYDKHKDDIMKRTFCKRSYLLKGPRDLGKYKSSE